MKKTLLFIIITIFTISPSLQATPDASSDIPSEQNYYGPTHDEKIEDVLSYFFSEKSVPFPVSVGNQIEAFLKEKNLPKNGKKGLHISIDKDMNTDRPHAHALASTKSSLNLITVGPEVAKTLLTYVIIQSFEPDKKNQFSQQGPQYAQAIHELESEASGKNHMHPWLQHKLLHEYGHWYFNHRDELYPFYKQQKEKNDRQLKAGIFASGITVPAWCHSILRKSRSLLPISLLSTASLLFTTHAITKKKTYVSRIPCDLDANMSALKEKCYEFEADNFAFNHMTTPALELFLQYTPTKEEFPNEYDDGKHPLAWQQRNMIERIIRQRKA